jgi:hypothetical protein
MLQKCVRTLFGLRKKNKKCGQKVASEGFDPPTLGLWAPCASSAPTRLVTEKILYNIKQVFVLKNRKDWNGGNGWLFSSVNC